MEQFQEHLEKAKKNIKIADHMLTQTYPLVKDPKLLVAVMENLFAGLENTISAVLWYDRIFKRIPAFHDNFENKYNIFKARCTRRYNFNISYLELIKTVHQTLLEHKKSPMEFARKNKFVICSDNYRMKTLSVDDMKQQVATAKQFLREVETMVSKTEGLFI